ncbi:MAG: HAMP domain-containing sensor histidine kinase [Bacteroidota bacterium]
MKQLNQVKDKFFSIISHDLRSPMNALAGTLDLLEQKNISQDEFNSLSKNLRTQFNHTRTLINNLLNWTLLQMDKLKIQSEKVLLHAKVEESFSALRMLYPKNIVMENKVGEKVTAYADPNIVNLVLRNLILNAVKFTESGGRIWISAEQNDKEITVSVSDNGIGIQPEVKEMLFEKTSGYSTRGTANEKGTGLGLILCKEFVEKNGGRIWLESELGKGTTFYFTLPKA